MKDVLELVISLSVTLLWLCSLALMSLKTKRLLPLRLVVMLVSGALLVLWWGSLTLLRSTSVILIGGFLGAKHLFYIGLPLTFILGAVGVISDNESRVHAVAAKLCWVAVFLFTCGAVWFIVEQGYRIIFLGATGW